MVPYSWILNCSEMVGTAKNIINMTVSRFDWDCSRFQESLISPPGRYGRSVVGLLLPSRSMSLHFMFLFATSFNLNLGLPWLRIPKQSWKYNGCLGILLISILCTLLPSVEIDVSPFEFMFFFTCNIFEPQSRPPLITHYQTELTAAYFVAANSYFGSLLLSILCTWSSRLTFFSMRISAIDSSPARQRLSTFVILSFQDTFIISGALAREARLRSTMGK